jgi:hypothetical protein
LPYEQKKLVQPPAQQGGPNRSGSFPFTQLAVLHVRVRDFFAPRGVVRLLGHDVVGPATANLLPIENDRKRAKRHVLQRDGSRNNMNPPFAQLDADCFKFVGEGRQIGRNLARRFKQLGGQRLLDVLPQQLQLTGPTMGRVVDIPG